MVVVCNIQYSPYYLEDWGVSYVLAGVCIHNELEGTTIMKSGASLEHLISVSPLPFTSPVAGAKISSPLLRSPRPPLHTSPL